MGYENDFCASFFLRSEPQHGSMHHHSQAVTMLDIHPPDQPELLLLACKLPVWPVFVTDRESDSEGKRALVQAACEEQLFACVEVLHPSLPEV